MDNNTFRDTMLNYGQDCFMNVFDGLSEAEQANILAQADLLDFSILKGAAEIGKELVRGTISPIRTLTMEDRAADADYYRTVGIDAIKDGKVGAVLLAGGMGTRLGSDRAKGMYDIGLTKPVYIFQRLIENLMDTVNEAGVWVHLFVMTSYLNDADTRSFFAEHDYFGYNPDYVSFFQQDMAPCIDDDGQVMFEDHDRIAMSPNGNGGFYSSMINCGLDIKAKEAGIEYLNVFAVDNVMQRIADPVFTGAVIAGGYDTGAKVVRKVARDEKVGAICLEDGAPSVVEYYDMTEELMDAVDDKGQPAYNFGVILNYLFKMESADKVVRNDLPIHVVRKKIPFYKDGVTVKPESPNGYKLEKLVLDLVHMTGTCLPFEVDRNLEFAPIKNPTGVDSVESARAMLQKAGYTL